MNIISYYYYQYESLDVCLLPNHARAAERNGMKFDKEINNHHSLE